MSPTESLSLNTPGLARPVGTRSVPGGFQRDFSSLACDILEQSWGEPDSPPEVRASRLTGSVAVLSGLKDGIAGAAHRLRVAARQEGTLYDPLALQSGLQALESVARAAGCRVAAELCTGPLPPVTVLNLLAAADADGCPGWGSYRSLTAGQLASATDPIGLPQVTREGVKHLLDSTELVFRDKRSRAEDPADERTLQDVVRRQEWAGGSALDQVGRRYGVLLTLSHLRSRDARDIAHAAEQLGRSLREDPVFSTSLDARTAGRAGLDLLRSAAGPGARIFQVDRLAEQVETVDSGLPRSQEEARPWFLQQVAGSGHSDSRLKSAARVALQAAGIQDRGLRAACVLVIAHGAEGAAMAEPLMKLWDGRPDALREAAQSLLKAAGEGSGRTDFLESGRQSLAALTGSSNSPTPTTATPLERHLLGNSSLPAETALTFMQKGLTQETIGESLGWAALGAAMTPTGLDKALKVIEDLATLHREYFGSPHPASTALEQTLKEYREADPQTRESRTSRLVGALNVAWLMALRQPEESLGEAGCRALLSRPGPEVETGARQALRHALGRHGTPLEQALSRTWADPVPWLARREFPWAEYAASRAKLAVDAQDSSGPAPVCAAVEDLRKVLRTGPEGASALAALLERQSHDES
ncbi:MAG: hypothetical protein AB1758_32415, partial [Candidatus Eremiobacterota bacterium]